jgi:hypothetical protein
MARTKKQSESKSATAPQQTIPSNSNFNTMIQQSMVLRQELHHNNSSPRHYSIEIWHYQKYIKIPTGFDLSKLKLETHLKCELDHLEYFAGDNEYSYDVDIPLDIIHSEFVTTCELLGTENTSSGSGATAMVNSSLMHHSTVGFQDTCISSSDKGEVIALVGCTATGIFSCVHDGDFDSDKHVVDQSFDIYLCSSNSDDADASTTKTYCETVDFYSGMNVLCCELEAPPVYVIQITRLANWWRCVLACRELTRRRIGAEIGAFAFVPGNPSALFGLERRGGAMFQLAMNSFKETTTVETKVTYGMKSTNRRVTFANEPSIHLLQETHYSAERNAAHTCRADSEK